MKKSFKFILPAMALIAVVYGCMKTEPVEPASIQIEEAPLITFQKATVIPGQYIVVFKENAMAGPSGEAPAPITAKNFEVKRTEMASEAKSILRQNEIVQKEIMQSYVKTLKGVALELKDDEVAKLRKDPRVAYIEQDQIFTVKMGGPPGGGGGGAAEVTPWGITRVGGAADGTGLRAWIIDSGIDLDHPDLNVNVGLSRTFLGGNTTPDDQNGHGSHVAGTVAAIDNEIGVIGVAAGAEVVSVRVLNRRGSGSNSGVIAGVDYVGANAASGDAANMSLGGGISTALDNAVLAASAACPFALAAGNESQDANNSSPARVNGSNIYTVSSMAQGDNWSSFSNYGNPPVDYCAPGSSILSTYKGGGYSTLSGTSMAAPHVCGILLLGSVSTSGTVSGDPSAPADDIAHH